MSSIVLYLCLAIGSTVGQYPEYLRQQQGRQLSSNGIPQLERESRSSPLEEFSVLAQPDYGDYLRVLTKRRMSKISCLKSCVGQHILHPMQCHSLC
ncbi:hypothetical protein BV898_03432 [Hypsibius exemplaris]|uniref:Uncharacterized protein n=1 Tax=Hypsibius exemplaris TaxID=2072580 RepID=A0A1W0X4W1_HYPEX|nr:hypothetical protein BV898_03432 [Hypsibius exemplaris]